MKDIETLDTTEKIIEDYIYRIDGAVQQYQEEKQLKELHAIDQQRWNAVLLYIYKHVFAVTKKDKKLYNEKSNLDYANKDLLDGICDVYICMCYEYGKEISIMGFSKMTGITKETLFDWVNNPQIGRGSSDLWKKLNAEREESLSNRLVSGKGNPIGILGILNRHYNWNMGQPRDNTPKVQQKSPEQIAQEYGIALEDQEKKAIPKMEF